MSTRPKFRAWNAFAAWLALALVSNAACAAIDPTAAPLSSPVLSTIYAVASVVADITLWLAPLALVAAAAFAARGRQGGAAAGTDRSASRRRWSPLALGAGAVILAWGFLVLRTLLSA